MRAAAPRRILHGVDGTTITATLELHATVDGLSGCLRDGTGATKEFTGWLGLVAAIDALVEGRTVADGWRAPTTERKEGGA